jgi:disulfide bond formation protein DsbB
LPKQPNEHPELNLSNINIPEPRLVNLLGFFACSAMMAFALYAEHVLYLVPCPLCVFQRMAVIAMGIIFLVSTIHNPAGVGRKVYAGLQFIAAGAGIIVAGRHVWLQNMPEDQVPACGPGFGYIIDSFPFSEALAMIFTGSGECANIEWQLFGLSMPAWVLISVVILGIVALWNNLRRV